MHPLRLRLLLALASLLRLQRPLRGQDRLLSEGAV